MLNWHAPESESTMSAQSPALKPLRRMDRRHGVLHWIAVAVGGIGGFVLGYGLVQVSGVTHGARYIALLATVEGALFAYLGFPYVARGWRALDLRLKTTPLSDLIAGLLGMVVGLIIAVLVGNFVREFPFGVPLSAILAALLAFFGASLGLTRRSELLVLAGFAVAGAEKEKPRRLRKVLLDTSVVIDGRILEVAETGFLDYPLVVTRSVLRELQQVADSPDSIRRSRGRRGLEVLEKMQELAGLELEFIDERTGLDEETDSLLIELAREKGWAIMTNDFNLNRVARIEGVAVLNLNELAGAMRPIAVPGEELTVALVKEGREPGQAVGYLDDGTMVVVENGRRLVNQTVAVIVASTLQTPAGRMIFAQPADQPPPDGRRGRQGSR